MSITEGLRNFIKQEGSTVPNWFVEELTAHADRIDKVHEKELSGQRGKGFDEGVNSTLMWDDDWLEGHGLVRLPKDKNGEVWHVGDEIADSMGGKAFEVDSMVVTYAGWEIRNGPMIFKPAEQRHHRPTPAERIRHWCDNFNEMDSNLHELYAIADELEGEGE